MFRPEPTYTTFLISQSKLFLKPDPTTLMQICSPGFHSYDMHCDNVPAMLRLPPVDPLLQRCHLLLPPSHHLLADPHNC